MDADRFDRFARFLTLMSSRRAAMTPALVGLLGTVGLDTASARRGKRRDKGKKKPPFNEFGCLDAGTKCRGNDRLCCSGVCQGQRPEKGRQDRSRCAARNVLTCRAEDDACLEAAVACGAAGAGQCFRTTGSASFCGVESQGDCFPCAKDADCRPKFGPGAACVVCEQCNEIDGSNGTGCVPPAA
jgi:hypothetical protein